MIYDLSDLANNINLIKINNNNKKIEIIKLEKYKYKSLHIEDISIPYKITSKKLFY